MTKMSRRTFTFGSLLLGFGAATGLVSEAEAATVVRYRGKARPGTIVVRTGQRRLYYVLPGGKAVRYKVGVGRAGRQWSGRSRVARKAVNPSWINPFDRKKRVIPPGPRNPLGPRALVLAHGQYAIHGTNNSRSIGGAVSLGCIRMYNRDILDLYRRARVGTPVVVTR